MKRARVEGYALVVVLWLIALLTIIAGGYLASARVEAKLLAQSLHRAQAEALADAAIWITLRDYLAANTDWSTRPAQLERTVDVGDTSVRVSLTDATGFVNLNNAPSELLEGVLTYAGVAPADRAALVAAILDWRDLDHVAAPDGAEDADYVRSGAAYGAKDAPFATVDELRFVRGMTDQVYASIAPLLTLFGDNTRVNVAAAPRDVLLALPRANGRSADEVMRSRTASGSTIDTDLFDQRFTQSAGGDVYLVNATAVEGSSTARVRASVRYARGENEPFQVLAWETRGDP